MIILAIVFYIFMMINTSRFLYLMDAGPEPLALGTLFWPISLLIFLIIFVVDFIEFYGKKLSFVYFLADWLYGKIDQ